MIERKTEKCKVVKIVYPKGSEVPQGMQFYIINTDIGTIKGKLSWMPLPEERLSLFGAWKTHPSYGRFFEFVTGRHDIPDDERAMLKYACELTKGIGEITEGDIWNAKGESWRELSIEDNVPRITPRVLTAFKETIEHLGLQQEKTRHNLLPDIKGSDNTNGGIRMGEMGGLNHCEGSNKLLRPG